MTNPSSYAHVQSLIAALYDIGCVKFGQFELKGDLMADAICAINSLGPGLILDIETTR